MKRVMYFMSAALMLTVFISSCSKDPLKDMTDEESRIYVTNRADSVDFSTYSTFSIADSVAVISNAGANERALTDYDKKLIADVSAAMVAKGYKLVSRTAKPDL